MTEHARHSPRRLQSVEIVPLGMIPSEVLKRLEGRLTGALGCRTVVAAPQAVPQSAYQPTRGQYTTLVILSAIRPVVWDRGWKRLGVADVDLYSANLAFVFGQADISGSTAIISLTRLKNEFYDLAPAGDLMIERAVKEAVHELGHTLGLAHCKKTSCVMYFSNSLVDTDRKDAVWCDDCDVRVNKGDVK